MITKLMVATLTSLLVLASGPDDTKDELAGIKCVVMGKQVKQDKSVKYKDGQVYLCCDKCVAAFETDPDKYAIKANHQLAATGQYVQKGCPMSGKPVAKGEVTNVGAVEVGFCCPGCKATVESASDLEAKSKLVFADKPFATAYVKKTNYDLTDVKCLMMPKRDVKAEQSVDYRDGQVFFCCKMCKSKFEKDHSEHTTAANQQLFVTGQYKQKACPFSGNPIDPEQMVELAGAKVGFCCDQCVGKVKGAADDQARAELVFSNERFEKAFEISK